MPLPPHFHTTFILLFCHFHFHTAFTFTSLSLSYHISHSFSYRVRITFTSLSHHFHVTFVHFYTTFASLVTSLLTMLSKHSLCHFHSTFTLSRHLSRRSWMLSKHSLCHFHSTFALSRHLSRRSSQHFQNIFCITFKSLFTSLFAVLSCHFTSLSYHFHSLSCHTRRFCISFKTLSHRFRVAFFRITFTTLIPFLRHFYTFMIITFHSLSHHYRITSITSLSHYFRISFIVSLPTLLLGCFHNIHIAFSLLSRQFRIPILNFWLMILRIAVREITTSWMDAKSGLQMEFMRIISLWRAVLEKPPRAEAVYLYYSSREICLAWQAVTWR